MFDRLAFWRPKACLTICLPGSLYGVVTRVERMPDGVTTASLDIEDGCGVRGSATFTTHTPLVIGQHVYLSTNPEPGVQYGRREYVV